jgi:hypothetical protein
MSEAQPISNAQLYKKKGRGHTPQISILRSRNAVPKGESFTWATTEMKGSHAWRAMPLATRQVVDRIEIEHGLHGGQLNGQLPVTYDDFEKYGIRRRSIPFGIRAAVALGWIDITDKGHRGAADVRKAARYALTWVDRHDGAPRTNRWKRCKTMADAEVEVSRVRPKKRVSTKKRKATGLKAVA